MKNILLAVITACIAFAVTPAFAAPQYVVTMSDSTSSMVSGTIVLDIACDGSLEGDAAYTDGTVDLYIVTSTGDVVQPIVAENGVWTALVPTDGTLAVTFNTSIRYAGPRPSAVSSVMITDTSVPAMGVCR